MKKVTARSLFSNIKCKTKVFSGGEGVSTVDG